MATNDDEKERLRSVALQNAQSILVARRRAEEELRKHSEWLRVTLSSIGDAVITTDIQGRVSFMNGVAESLTGWPQAEALGRPLSDVFHIINEQSRGPVENPALQEGSIVGLANHTVLIAKDGTERPIDDSAAPIRDESGKVAGCVLVFRDVTDRRRADRAVRQSEARKAAILETAPDCIITIDDQGRIVEFNPAAEQTFGYRYGDVLGREMGELIVPTSHRERHYRGLAHFLATGEGPVLNRRIEMPALRADGTEFPAELTITAIPQDGPPFFTAYLRDISEPRRAESRRAARLCVTQILAEAATIGEAAPRILSAICENLHWDAGAIWELDSDANALRCLEVWHQPTIHIDEFEAISRHRTFAPGVGLPGRIWANSQPAWIPDVVMDNNFPRARIATKEGLHGAFGVPLMTGADFLGVIEFFSHEIREPDSDLLEMMNTIGSQVGQFMDRKRAEQALRESEGPLRLAQGIASIGTFEWDIQTDVNRWTPELEVMYGLKPGEFGATQRSWEALIHPDDRAETIRRVEAAMEGGRFEGEWRVVWPDGTTRWLAGRAWVFKNAQGKPSRVIGVNIDITERKHTEELLRDADRRKDEFLATLAHELRNPLAPIRNMLEIMKRTDLDTKDKTIEQARDTMDRQLGQMVRLIDDLLDISRISRGKIELRRGRVELASVIHHAVEAARSAAEDARHELTVTLPPQPVYLYADPVRLAQVFGNLLNNACKYTEPGGGGRISFSADLQEADVVISVKDNGVGIPPDMLHEIFTMFTQVDHSLERSQGGLGIGLSLAKNLVELHGGSVEAISKGLDRGSEFLVRLPIMVETAKPTSYSATSEPTVPKSGTLKPLRILVVDDNSDSARSMAILLKLSGNETQIAHDGLEAVDAAQAFKPDAILLDIGLPKLNGYEAARKIREQPGGKEVLLIAVTGWGQDEDRSKSKEAGFDAHIVKPVDPDALTQLLAHLFAKHV